MEFEHVVSALTHMPDDPELIAGMPVGVQIVGGKFGEEKTVSVAKALEEALGPEVLIQRKTA